MIAIKERLRCGDRVNGVPWPVVPQSVQAASRQPPEIVEAELERLQRNLSKVRQNKSRGWESEAASLGEREGQLQAELAGDGLPRAAPALGGPSDPQMQRPLLDVEAELRRVQRNISHAREQRLSGWETAVAQLYKREQRLLDELARAAGSEPGGQQPPQPAPAPAAERAGWFGAMWR
ncbi:hypothetical protein WJX81_006022 [Elliptochloris bilobata]|uniref:Uncharacterized protein n=1 Tax=Elliptochloris bilobata TaxID=381761 RepID=A0AAW1SC44_9CHLO